MISNSNGTPAGLTKTGSGTLVLSGANTYGNTTATDPGITTISAGTLGITGDSALGALVDPSGANINPTLKILPGATGSATLKFLNSFILGNRGMQIQGTANIDTNNKSVLYTGQILTLDGSDTLTIINSAGSTGVFQMNNSASSYRSLTIKSNARLDLISANNDGLLGDAPGAAKANWLTFDGGTLKLSGSGLATAGGNGFNKGITVTANGGTIDIGSTLTATFPMTGTGLTGVVGAGALNVKGGGTLNIKGIFTPTLNIDNATVQFSSGFSSSTAVGVSNTAIIDTNGNDVALGNVTGAGSLTKNSAGKLTVNHVRAGDLTVNGGTLALAANGGAAGVSKVGALAVSAKLDLMDNHLISTSSIGTATAGVYNGVTGLIQTGRGTGSWNGSSGILTSQTVATTSNFNSIGVATGSEVKGIPFSSTATAVWAGQTVTGTDTLVMYTYGGDANLDGKINVDDYGRIDFAVPLGIAGWSNGDFNYDGKINVDDYGIIDFNVGIQGTAFYTSGGSELPGTSAGLTAVPEPTGLSVIGVASAATLLSARRRVRRRLK